MKGGVGAITNVIIFLSTSRCCSPVPIIHSGSRFESVNVRTIQSDWDRTRPRNSRLPFDGISSVSVSIRARMSRGHFPRESGGMELNTAESPVFTHGRLADREAGRSAFR
jgi:hypothetical protein